MEKNLLHHRESLPTDSALALHLIRAELRFQNLACILDQAQIDIHLHSPDLSGVILSLCGLSEQSDELFTWYVNKLDEYVVRMNEEDSDIKTLALNFFVDIQIRLREISEPRLR